MWNDAQIDVFRALSFPLIHHWKTDCSHLLPFWLFHWKNALQWGNIFPQWIWDQVMCWWHVNQFWMQLLRWDLVIIIQTMEATNRQHFCVAAGVSVFQVAFLGLLLPICLCASCVVMCECFPQKNANLWKFESGKGGDGGHHLANGLAVFNKSCTTFGFESPVPIWSSITLIQFHFMKF